MSDPTMHPAAESPADSPQTDASSRLAPALRDEASRLGLTVLLASVVPVLVVFALAMTKGVENAPLLAGLALIILTGLLGLGLSKVLRGLSMILRELEAHTRQLESLEKRLEQVSLSSGGARDGESSSYLKPQRLAEIRIALRNSNWQDAETLVRMFEEGHPDDPESIRIAQELTAARDQSSQEILAKIKAAREVNDPDRVIELRESLKPILKGDPLRDLDRDLARWFMNLIQKRLRAGTVGVDVAVLAARVAGVLDETAEGASLRASLPTLRRAASLCPRCAQPYGGIADACPACVTQALAHHNAMKSRGSGTFPAYQVPKTIPTTETVE